MNQMRRNQALVLVLLVALVYLVVHKHVVSGGTVVFFVVLFGSVILHEISHGALAWVFGDDTAKRAGRLTLNPIRHIDPFGTIILPAILLLTGVGAFGWAKPVPVNVARLRHPRNQSLLVSLVGPAVNVVLALIGGLAFRAVTHTAFVNLDTASLGLKAVYYLGFANVLLAAFNLIPIPPLDGSAVIERLLPRSWWPSYLQLRMFALPVLLILVFLVPSALNHVFAPAIGWWGHVVGRQVLLSHL